MNRTEAAGRGDARGGGADEDASPRIEMLTVGPFQSNCYVVHGERALVIDPGDEPDRILERLGGGDVAAILLTHAHVDHVGGVAAVAAATGAPVHLHPADRFLYDAAAEHARVFGLSIEPPPPPDVELEDGERLSFEGIAGLEFEVRHAPGHSPGHVVFAGRGAASGVAFVGDCVFAGSIGRTDLPGGDTATLLSSIRRRILSLPPQTVLYPGHMGPTSVEKEERTNPFLIRGGYA